MSLQFKCCRAFVALLLVALPATAAADEVAELYETVSDASIGPVFLTPAQRELLDQRRLLPPSVAAVGRDSDQSDRLRSVTRQSAGYIVSSSGQRRDWSGGEFVVRTSTDTSKTSFPGDVKVVRHGSDTGDEKVVESDDENEN